MAGGKARNHGTNPRSVRLARDGAAKLAREERHAARRERPTTADGQASALAYCPRCGKGLSARFRLPDEMHLARSVKPPQVCAWRP